MNTIVNTMKMVYNNGKWQQEEVAKLEKVDLEIHANGSATVRYKSRAYIIDRRQVKYAWKKMKVWATDKEGAVGTVLKSGGVFYPIFLEFIFPWILDIGKVWCAIKICQAFLQEKNGSAGSDGRTGVQAVIHYGKWFIFLEAIPFIVELIDQIGTKMVDQLNTKEISLPTTGARPSLKG